MPGKHILGDYFIMILWILIILFKLVTIFTINELFPFIEMPESFFSLGFMISPEVFIEALKIFFLLDKLLVRECDSLPIIIRYLLLDILYIYLD